MKLWIQKTLLLFFSLFLVLLGAEVFVRYYDPQILSFLHSRKSFAPPIYQANDKWLFELRPGTDYLHESPYKDFQVSVRVNRGGFRSLSDLVLRTTRRILLC
jgi:hypothetical protein